MSPIDPYCVPSSAILASRFFATLNWAPASRIFRRRSVDCATDRPRLRVMTTTLVSVKTFFSSATRSAFCERSMPTPFTVRPKHRLDRDFKNPGQAQGLAEELMSVGLGIACAATHERTAGAGRMISLPRLGRRLREANLSATVSDGCTAEAMRGAPIAEFA